ncbi:MAG: hypothetical protein ACO1SV_08070 [Fimbriimonas sp.]
MSRDPRLPIEPLEAMTQERLAFLVEAGLAQPDGTCTREQTRMMMLGELIIDFYLDSKERGLLNEDGSLKEKDPAADEQGPNHPELPAG